MNKPNPVAEILAIASAVSTGSLVPLLVALILMFMITVSASLRFTGLPWLVRSAELDHSTRRVESSHRRAEEGLGNVSCIYLLKKCTFCKSNISKLHAVLETTFVFKIPRSQSGHFSLSYQTFKYKLVIEHCSCNNKQKHEEMHAIGIYADLIATIDEIQ